MTKIIKEQQRISKHKIEEWQPPHLTLQKSKGVFKQPHFQSAGDLIHTVIYYVCTFFLFSLPLLLFQVTFFLAYSKKNLMSKLKSYMHINLSFQKCAGQRGNYRGDLCVCGGENTTYCKKLLYCKVTQVFKEKGTSSLRKLCQLRLFESAIFFARCWGQ